MHQKDPIHPPGVICKLNLSGVDAAAMYGIMSCRISKASCLLGMKSFFSFPHNFSEVYKLFHDSRAAEVNKA